MKNIAKISVVLLLFFQIQSCKKDKPIAPTITTSDISTITQTSASGGGTITSDGGSTIISRGVCWSINNTPTENDKKTTNGAGAGSFVSTITDLSPNTVYFVRAYATNASGTGYGMAMSFTTLPASKPVLTTSNATSITQISAIAGGIITSDGAALITSRGLCWSTSQNPTTSDNKTTEGSGPGTFSSSITGLFGNTTYYIRAYAINSAGTEYGNQVSFKTNPIIPSITTNAVSNITQNSATCGGNITSEGGAMVLARGVCWNTSTNPTISDSKTSDSPGIGAFQSSITGLTRNTTYYVRSYATNSVGTAYGNEIVFTSSALSTSKVTSITQTTAISGGSIISDGGAPITDRGVCWNTSTNPTILNNKTSDGTGIGDFTSQISGLIAGTKYYVRSFATNSIGTSYGNEIIFNTYTGSVNDIDGNVYKTVTIGTQIWMAENLKTTKYNDGTLIPNVTDDNAWYQLTTGGYCWYNNDAVTYSALYGALYNWYSGNTSKLCPTNWHVPTDAEWTTLTNYLGGYDVAGGKLKETGTSHWLSPNTGATNETGFTALPGGYRNSFIQIFFHDIGIYGEWWSSSLFDNNDAWYQSIDLGSSDILRKSRSKNSGLSVRCIKD